MDALYVPFIKKRVEVSKNKTKTKICFVFNTCSNLKHHILYDVLVIISFKL